MEPGQLHSHAPEARTSENQVNLKNKRLNSTDADRSADATDITQITSDGIFFTARIADEAHGLFGLITEDEN